MARGGLVDLETDDIADHDEVDHAAVGDECVGLADCQDIIAANLREDRPEAVRFRAADENHVALAQFLHALDMPDEDDVVIDAMVLDGFLEKTAEGVRADNADDQWGIGLIKFMGGPIDEFRKIEKTGRLKLVFRAASRVIVTVRRCEGPCERGNQHAYGDGGEDA